MDKIKQRYKEHFSNKDFLYSLIFSILLFGLSLVVNYYAGIYALERASEPVTDLILSNIRVYDVDLAFVYGPVVFWIFIAVLIFTRPARLPFVLKSIALFVLIRSVFITLTHIGPFPTHIIISTSKVIEYFTSGADLFFSAHTGLPFLMALLFWENIYLRMICIATAIFFGVIVLLGHLHYSIDVLSAFFITYTIYHIASVFFRKDKERLSRAIQE